MDVSDDFPNKCAYDSLLKSHLRRGRRKASGIDRSPFRGKLAVARRLLQGSELFLQPVNGALFLEALAMCTTR